MPKRKIWITAFKYHGHGYEIEFADEDPNKYQPSMMHGPTENLLRVDKYFKTKAQAVFIGCQIAELLGFEPVVWEG